MGEIENTAVVQRTYAAFGRGDIPGVLDTLATDVVWAPVIGASPAVPTGGERCGRAAVADFFTTLSRSLTFEVFEPREFVAQGDKVVVLGYYRAKTAAGRPFASDWVMIFTLAHGKVTRFQEFTDVAALNAAFEGVPA